MSGMFIRTGFHVVRSVGHPSHIEEESDIGMGVSLGNFLGGLA